MRMLSDYKYDKYLSVCRFVLLNWNNTTIRSLFVYTKANYEGGLRAAKRYHANGVSFKQV